MTYLKNLQANPVKRPYLNESNCNNTFVTPMSRSRKRPKKHTGDSNLGTFGAVHNRPESSGYNFRSISSDSQDSNSEQKNMQSFSNGFPIWRQRFNKREWRTTTTGPYRSGDRFSNVQTCNRDPMHFLPPGLGDTAEVNRTQSSKFQHLGEYSNRFIRNQTSIQPPSQIMHQSRHIQVVDRRDICRAQADRRHAARLACLLATEAAVENARKRALELREAKLLELRSRTQLRQQQVEARRKALEEAEKERLALLAQRLRRIAMAHPPGQGRFQHPRLGFQTRSLRTSLGLSNTFNVYSAQSDRRPIVAFGSATPRTVCFTSRELRETSYVVNNDSNSSINKNNNNKDSKRNSVPSDQLATSEHLSAVNSYTVSTCDSQPSLRQQNLTCRQNRGNIVSRDRRKRVRSSHSSYSRSPPSLHTDNLNEDNGNAIGIGLTSCRANRTIASAQKKTSASSSYFGPNVAKRVHSARPKDSATSSGPKNHSSKNVVLRSGNASTIKTKSVDVNKVNSVAKSSVTKTGKTRRGPSPVTKGHHSVSRPNHLPAVSTTKRNANRSENQKDESKPVMKSADGRTRVSCSVGNTTVSDTTTDEETYRLKMLQQRRKVRDQITLGNALTTNHGEIMGPSIQIGRSSIKDFADEDLIKLSEHETRTQTPLHAGDLMSEDPSPTKIQESVPTFEPDSTYEVVLRPASPRNDMNISHLESNLLAGSCSQTDQDETLLTHTTATSLQANLYSRSLNFSPIRITNVLNGQEIAEREARRRRLEDIMARLKPVNENNSPRKETTLSSSIVSDFPNDITEGTTPLIANVLQSDGRPSDPASSMELRDNAQLYSRPQSSTSGYYTDPVFSNESVVWPIETDTGTNVLSCDKQKNEMQTTTSTSFLSLNSSPNPKRANVVANLLASGRLNVRSRAATILLNLASGRPPTDGLGPQNYSNGTTCEEALVRATSIRREPSIDMGEVMPH
ncbi:hypothetical protein FGIG_08994 [Fasciola gigantica]|uniref:Uncharacterized protein n=1 Tax=Fasciola gigantica TaxID=46835 RepID=A0A504Y932_FASGI|nr:hypothetical protein FGIG_08994 [Fasciola gigantica]